jgi:hypothetical protein
MIDKPPDLLPLSGRHDGSHRGTARSSATANEEKRHGYELSPIHEANTRRAAAGELDAAAVHIALDYEVRHRSTTY